jgi:transmembrane 9 superfamily protein 3
VILWVNKVGPYRNPQETYKYFALPFCKPSVEVETHAEGLGEALQGYELMKSALVINFTRDVTAATVCSRRLSRHDVALFRHAIEQQYWYQLFIDDLPVWGMVGEYDGERKKHFLYTHLAFNVAYNNDRIIEVSLAAADNRFELVATDDTADVEVTFTYAVRWHATDASYEKRFDKYLDDHFFEHQIHWFSVFNSFMMVVFLVGLVAMILMRTLRQDYARFTREDDLDEDERIGDERGWKHVHGDVFRPPPNLVLFAALIGTGTQLATMVLFVVLCAIAGTYYVKRGTLVTAVVLAYAVTSFVAGFVGGALYARNGGRMWIANMITIAGFFPGLILSIGFVLDWIAVAYQSLASVPIGTMIVVVLLWALVAFPLTLMGTILGKHRAGERNVPCRINPVPRHIPVRPWYWSPLVHVLAGGILPFGSIFIEMYFVFTAFWHYKYYYVYGFLLLVYAILVIVTACVTIVSTYFLLNAEDYRWQWTSFLSGASTALYVYLYAIYYFYFKTSMSGFFQTAFYFGYMLMFCIALAILAGSIGYMGSSMFVHAIYGQVKIE